MCYNFEDLYESFSTNFTFTNVSPAPFSFGPRMTTIGSTTKIKNLDHNIGSLGVKLTREDLKEISDVIPINEVAGDRITENFILCSWKFANTPAKESKLV